MTVDTPVIWQARLKRLADRLGKALEISGRWLSALPLVFVLVQFAVTVLVYVFAAEVTKLKDSLYYINALMIFAAAGYTALHDEHVRVDIFHARLSPRMKDWITIVGTLGLMFPVILFLAIELWPTVVISWSRLQGSMETGGLPFVFILKSIPLLFVISLLMSGLRDIALAAARLLAAPGESR